MAGRPRSGVSTARRMHFRSYWFTSGVIIPTRAQGDGGLSCQPLHTCSLSRPHQLDAHLGALPSRAGMSHWLMSLVRKAVLLG